jgi:aspartyl-tRNA(Asn)/glutamyl-tRNA(Gln) amidotransferase subunit A
MATLPTTQKSSGSTDCASRAGGYFARMGAPEAIVAVDAVAEALGVTRLVELPEVYRTSAAAFPITTIEGATQHRNRIRSSPHAFDPEVRDRLIAGAMLPGEWYVKAQKFRRWYRERVLSLLGETDLILAPATPISAPLVDERTSVLDGRNCPCATISVSSRNRFRSSTCRSSRYRSGRSRACRTACSS